ncbi:MAG: septum formation initiator family protein [Clostridium butyricum]|nr:septum formation initiator family protein [Clostridium butyricum]
MRKKSILKKLIVIVFLFIFSFGYIRQMITMNRIEKEIEIKQSQLDEIKAKHERLQDEVDKIDQGSLDYLERLARERLGMIKQGEKVVNSEESREEDPN